MENINSRDPLIERRHNNAPKSNNWEKLTLAQRFSASSLAKYDYELMFVRVSESGSLAVLIHDGHCVTIADDGDINTRATIHTR